jgi:hypothetical protein
VGALAIASGGAVVNQAEMLVRALANLSNLASHLSEAPHLHTEHRDPLMEEAHLAKAANVNH